MAKSPSGWHLLKIEVAVATLVVLLLVALLLPAVQRARESARRSQSKNNLKQVGIAFHNYHESHDCFPPGGTFAEDGTPHHSWTLFIQPYMSASRLYSEIDFNRPWDDVGNRNRFRAGYSGLEDPGILPSKTPDGLPVVHYSVNQRLFYRNSSSRLKDIPNPAQTLLTADAFGRFAAFGDPINWRDATTPFRTSQQGFGHISSDRKDGTHVLFVDGSVEFVSNSIATERHGALAGIGLSEPPGELTAQRQGPEPGSGMPALWVR